MVGRAGVAGREVWWLCLATSFFDNLAIAFVIPLLPALAAAGGAAPGMWIWVAALNGLVLTLGPFVWGGVICVGNVDRVISRTLAVKAFFAATLAWPSLGWVWLLVNRAATGAMSGTSIATQLRLVAATRDQKGKARAIAGLSIAGSLGIGSGVLVSMPLVAAAEASSDITVTAAPALLTFSVLLLALGLFVRARLTAAAPAAAAPEIGEVLHEREVSGYWRGGAVAAVAINTLTRCATHAFPIVLLLTAEQDRRISFGFATLVIGLLSFLEMPGQAVVPRLVTGAGYRAAALALITGAALSAVLPAFAMTPAAILVSAAGFAFAVGALQSLLSVYLTELRIETVPRWLGTLHGMGGAARALAPVAAAAAFRFGAEAAFFAIALATAAGATLVHHFCAHPGDACCPAACAVLGKRNR